jgi:hypothetical protein
MLAVVTGFEYQVLAGINAVSGGLAIFSGIYAAFRPRDQSPPKPSEIDKQGTDWSPLAQWSPWTGTRIGLSVKF